MCVFFAISGAPNEQFRGQVVQRLLAAGAEKEARDLAGRTALGFAAAGGHETRRTRRVWGWCLWVRRGGFQGFHQGEVEIWMAIGSLRDALMLRGTGTLFRVD